MTDNDRELIELAAKAYGIQVKGWLNDKLIGFDTNTERPVNGDWNPLESDGDALRLLVKISQRDGEADVKTETAAPIMGIICEFLSGVNPTGYVPTVKSSYINRTRAKKGKPPLHYTWKTVTIEPPKQKTEWMGGTHASPRKHQRRGHWRNHPSGKRVWVRDCWVGDASMGAVMKDYKIMAAPK